MAGIDLKKANKILPYPMLIFTSISIIILSFFIIFSIIPGYRSIKKIRQDIEVISVDLGVSNKIIPAFVKAKKINEIHFEPNLSFPNRKRLDHERLPGLLNKFQSIALNHKLGITDNKLDNSFLSKQSDSVSIILRLHGQLQDFRDFLISIISLPFFETIETISIHPGKNNSNIFSINFKINVETKHE